MADTTAPIRAPLPPLLRRLAALDLFVAAGAFFGGAALFWKPDGSALSVPLSMLESSPFTDFLIPGMLLFFLVGGTAFVAGVSHLLRGGFAGQLSLLAGATLVGWIVVQVFIIGSVHGLHIFYLMLGLLQVGIAIRALGQAAPS